MKLDALVEQFPWRNTFELLCREPPEEGSLHLTGARQVIWQQRGSQLAVLSRMMYSPVLEGNERPDDAVEGDQRVVTSRRLRLPDRTSRLFLASAAQAGKALRPFGPERLGELEQDEAALGHLLLVLSVAQSSPKSRAAHSHEWAEITRQGIESRSSLPFGPVLTPMLFSAELERSIQGDHHDLVRHLTTELSDRSRDSGKLARWTSSLVRTGAARLRRLSGSPRSVLTTLRELKRKGIDDPDIDLWIGIYTSDVETLRAALDAGADVNVTIGTVVRRHRDRL